MVLKFQGDQMNTLKSEKYTSLDEGQRIWESNMLRCEAG